MLKPSQEQIQTAAKLISEYLDPTPLKLNKEIGDRIGANTHIKCEYSSPVNSFKLRGSLNLVSHLTRSNGISKIITASTGNHGAAMAYACREFGVPITVGVPLGADKKKVELIESFGGRLEFIGRDLDESKAELLSRPMETGEIFIEDGSRPEIVAGTATIGLEILKELDSLDMIIVPVGNGALIGGIGTVLKNYDTNIKVIGVQSEKAPCMTHSFNAGHPVDTENCDTFAGGIAVRVAIPEAVDLMLEVVDEMWLISENEMKRAMTLYYQISNQLLEGAGAATLAAVLKFSKKVKNKTVCLIASGSNVDEKLKQEVLP